MLKDLLTRFLRQFRNGKNWEKQVKKKPAPI